MPAPCLLQANCHRNAAKIGLKVSLMSIWGKLGGAAAGFLLGGGPIGAIAGAFAGHMLFDRDLAAEGEEPGIIFTIAVIALSAKMAKADGTVLIHEVEAFDRILRLPASEEAN